MPEAILIDSLLCARWVIPITPANVTLENFAVAIKNGEIIDLLPIDQARQKYLATETVDLGDHVLLPGFVNLHAHTAMSLMRGIADDLPLMRWLNEAIWPRERQYVSPQFVYEGTLLGAAEMLRSGITCCNDNYFYPDDAARAYADIGLRAMVGMAIIEFPSSYASDAADYIAKGLAARDRWQGNPLIDFAFAPHAPYTVSNASFERIASLAEELDALIHLHLHETRDEISQSEAEHGMRPLARLQSLGLLGPNLVVAHAVHMTDSEIEALAQHAVSIAHNPTSNMKLASGIAPISAMLRAGINIGLGTDGAASNNRQDIMQEMRHAALLAKVSSGDAAALPAHQTLRMATLNGAKALGLDTRIGSIETGKQADLCAIALNDSLIAPYFDAAAHLIYAAGREHISHVWTQGQIRVHNGCLLHPHNTELLRISQHWRNTLKNRTSDVS